MSQKSPFPIKTATTKKYSEKYSLLSDLYYLRTPASLKGSPVGFQEKLTFESTKEKGRNEESKLAVNPRVVKGLLHITA